MITRALERGELQPAAPIVELTSGNLGCGLALVCAVLGHPLTLAMSKGNSPQRAAMMRALGANVQLIDQVDGSPGNVTRADLSSVDCRGREIARETGAFYVDQMNNKDNPRTHEDTTGPEIWRQTGGHVDAFVAIVGSAGTFTGVSQYLKKMKPEVKCFAVEPEGSQPIRGCQITKPHHLLQGSGYAYVPSQFTFDTLHDTLSVSDEEAVHHKKLLATKEGLHVGYTSVANVAAVVKLLKSGILGEDPWIVTVLPDTGLKYPEI